LWLNDVICNINKIGGRQGGLGFITLLLSLQKTGVTSMCVIWMATFVTPCCQLFFLFIMQLQFFFSFFVVLAHLIFKHSICNKIFCCVLNTQCCIIIEVRGALGILVYYLLIKKCLWRITTLNLLCSEVFANHVYVILILVWQDT
jgi:hypothetical protein